MIDASEEGTIVVIDGGRLVSLSDTVFQHNQFVVLPAILNPARRPHPLDDVTASREAMVEEGESVPYDEMRRRRGLSD
jgi:hypothetical protein